jgi:hypothetical protein
LESKTEQWVNLSTAQRQGWVVAIAAWEDEQPITEHIQKMIPSNALLAGLQRTAEETTTRVGNFSGSKVTKKLTPWEAPIRYGVKKPRSEDETSDKEEKNKSKKRHKNKSKKKMKKQQQQQQQKVEEEKEKELVIDEEEAK